MDMKSLFHLSYGLFVIGVNEGKRLNGCVVNSVMQVTSSPVQLAVVINKDNLTHDLVHKRKSLVISVLAEDVEMSSIARFGFQSGKAVNKFPDGYVELDCDGNPYLPHLSTAYLSGKVVNSVDVESHTMFIVEVTEGEVFSQKTPLTYKYYQEVKKGTSPKNATTYQDKGKKEGQHYCSICQYVYEGEVAFEDLEDGYLCPVCSNGKEVFKQK